ncbi:MAG: GGDEF domain-containing protein [Acidimicrobiales bacterium]
MLRARHHSGSTFTWGLALTSVVALVVAGMLFAGAQARGTEVEDLARAAATDELLEARRDLELATVEVVAVRMLDAVGVAGDRSGRLDAAAGRTSEAMATITRLAERDDLIGTEARALLADADLEALDDPRVGDLAEVFAVAEDYARWSGAPDVVLTQQDAIQQLSFVSALPFHVLIEGTAADASVNGRPVDPAAADFLDTMTDVVRTTGGWFGVDPTTPLDGSIWIEIDEARDLLTAPTADLDRRVAASDLVAYDRWSRELRDGDDPPPFSLSEMLAAIDALQPDVESVIDELVADDSARRDAARQDATGQRQAMLALAVACIVVALALGVVLVRRLTHAARLARERAELATTDALTGVGNRRDLDERVRPLSTDPRLHHHLVVIIDLDDFKLVNDLHGHAAGDAILVEVAQRLSRLAAHTERDHPGTVAAVIRLGGDEFLVTVHAPGDWDEGGFRAGIDDIRSDSFAFGDERIPLRFSAGFARGEGPRALSDLMQAADLAVYDDKAARNRARAADAATRDRANVTQDSAG